MAVPIDGPKPFNHSGPLYTRSAIRLSKSSQMIQLLLSFTLEQASKVKDIHKKKDILHLGTHPEIITQNDKTKSIYSKKLVINGLVVLDDLFK